MPAAGLMFEEADRWADCSFAPLTLGDGLQALAAVQISLHLVIALPNEILPASFANETFLVPGTSLERNLFGTHAYRFLAFLAFIGVFVETALAKQLSFLVPVLLSLEQLVTLGATEVFFVPLLSMSFGVRWSKYQLDERNSC